jgi:hypothetical protein
MLRVASTVCTAILVASFAFAQTRDVCTGGYDKASKDGMLAKLSKDSVTKADSNKDGKISKAEFDAACQKKIFMQEQKN